MKRNVEMFDRVADAIERNPELYNQYAFGKELSCGTAHCVAGWAAYLDGWRSLTRSCYTTVEKGEEKISTLDVATNLLGLSSEEGDRLFGIHWKPPPGMTVPDALRGIGRGEVEIE